MSDKLIILQGKKRWVAERILASVFFAVIVYVSYLFFTNTPFIFTEKIIKRFGDYFRAIAFCASLGVYYSYETHHHFNLNTSQYRTFYTIGPFGFGKWRAIDKLSYVAVNHLTKKNIFEVNIWDESNNRYKVSYHDDKGEAKETAKYLAQKFIIDYYDKDEDN